MEDQRDSRLLLPLAGLLLIVAYELSLIGGAIATATWLWLGWRNAERANAELHRLMSERQAERDQWRASAQQALAGLAVAIDHQLGAWV